MNPRTPTYRNQLIAARELLRTKGADALNNPHAMIGRECGCGACFCCAALEVYRASRPLRDATLKVGPL